MNHNPYKRPGPLPALRGLALVLATVVGSGALFAMLVVSGVIELPFLRKAEAARQKPKPEGTPVLISARFIPAYTQMTRDFVLDDKTGEFTVAHLRPEDAASQGFLPLDKIIGRVLKTDKAAGYAFREKDFLPEGTRPGTAAGVPPGKRALVLPAERIGGINALKIGDRVDILMSMPIEPQLGHAGKGGEPSPGLPPPAQPGHASGSGRMRRAGVQAIVQDGVVVVPVTTRQAPVTTSNTGKDGKFQTKPVQDITIAVDPTEAAQLMQALAVDTEMFCVLRSGLPGDPPGRTPSLAPPPPPVQVEVIAGNKREIKTFGPRGGASPLPMPPDADSYKLAADGSEQKSEPKQP